MRAPHLRMSQHLCASLVVGACFLLAATCWICWLYRLLELAPSSMVDGVTLVGGYLMQALGSGVYLLMARRLPWGRMRRMSVACVVLGTLCAVPSLLSANLLAVLSFGLLHNVAWGFLAGFYLHVLAKTVGSRDVPLAFGGAYAVTTALSWALSVPGGGFLLRGMPAVATCFVLAVLAGALVARCDEGQDPEEEPAPVPDLSGEEGRPTLLLACVTVVLFSMVKNGGYGLPTEDLLSDVSLEVSRLLYGVGLVAAGFVNRRGRNLGALCCMTALVLPFLTLALVGISASGAILWATDYLLFGFYIVYRVVVWVDLAKALRRPYVAGAGLLLGRVGDALGSGLSFALAEHSLWLVCVVAVLFALTSVSFFLLYQRLYIPVVAKEPTEQELFELFAGRHDLSMREREVLRLVLGERTNSQIATELFVSESTVKFHVRNLLRKTGCTNRRQLLALYHGCA